MRNAHAREPLSLLQPRWAMSLMLGPMTRSEIRRALGKTPDKHVARDDVGQSAQEQDSLDEEI